MTTTTIALGARTQLAGAAAALNSLASATYVVLGTITFANGVKTPLDAKLEVCVTPGTVGAPNQVSIYAQESLDGATFGTGPVAGTTTVDEPDLRYIGSIPCFSNGTLQRGIFTLAARFGGMLPFAARIIAKNETGAALASSGNDCFYQVGNGDTV
ncbi:MAG: hypothetical protein ACRYGA_02470 [Janthinobacterium lividum]